MAKRAVGLAATCALHGGMAAPISMLIDVMSCYGQSSRCGSGAQHETVMPWGMGVAKRHRVHAEPWLHGPRKTYGIGFSRANQVQSLAVGAALCR